MALVYPNFETDPHPDLQCGDKLSLRTREIDCFDYTLAKRAPGRENDRMTRQTIKLGRADGNAKYE